MTTEIMVRTKHGTAPLEWSRYPNGEPIVQWNDAVRVEAMLLRPRDLTGLFAGLFFVDALRERGHPSPLLILPCVPGSRQDRRNAEGDYLFTAKSVAQAINARNFPSVTVLDPHSDVIAGLIDRCVVVAPPVDLDMLGNVPSYLGVIAPDGGAEKRAAKVAKCLRLPLFHAWKSRDVATGAITGFGCEPIERGHYLVVDDLCDAGGTFIGLAGVLNARRCTADLYVTHGLFTKGTAALLSQFSRLFTTDSTLDAKEGVTVFPACRVLLETTI